MYVVGQGVTKQEPTTFNGLLNNKMNTGQQSLGSSRNKLLQSGNQPT